MRSERNIFEKTIQQVKMDRPSHYNEFPTVGVIDGSMCRVYFFWAGS
jgi:predicted TIM-barrel enzyme